jgi:hypothetical protein
LAVQPALSTNWENLVSHPGAEDLKSQGGISCLIAYNMNIKRTANDSPSPLSAVLSRHSALRERGSFSKGGMPTRERFLLRQAYGETTRMRKSRWSSFDRINRMTLAPDERNRSLSA